MALGWVGRDGNRLVILRGFRKPVAYMGPSLGRAGHARPLRTAFFWNPLQTL